MLVWLHRGSLADELWSRVEPVLPVRPAGRTGLKPLPDRQVLQGSLFVLYTDIEPLPTWRVGRSGCVRRGVTADE